MEIVGGDVVLCPLVLAVKQATAGIIFPFSQELEGHQGMCSASLTQVNLKRLQHPLGVSLVGRLTHGDKVNTEALDRSFGRQVLANDAA